MFQVNHRPRRNGLAVPLLQCVMEDVSAITPPSLTISACDCSNAGPSSGRASCESLPSASSFECLWRTYDAEKNTLTEAGRVIQEAKIVRSLCRLLHTTPSAAPLQTWLRIIGLSPEEWRTVCAQVKDLSSLVSYDSKQIAQLCERCGLSASARKRLITSTDIIRTYLRQWRGEHVEPFNSFSDKQLSWTVSTPVTKDRWTKSHSTSHGSLSSPAHSGQSACSTPGTTSGAGFPYPVLSSSSAQQLPPTPSSRYSESTSVSSAELSVNARLTGVRNQTLSPPSPLSTQSTPSLAPIQRVPQSSSMQFAVPRSPKDPSSQRLIHHAIPHKWKRKNTFQVTDNPCSFCRRPLGFAFINSWEKCTSCKLKVHTHCKSRVGDSCGLTAEHLRAVFDDLIQQNNQNWWHPHSALPASRSFSSSETTAFQYPDPAAIGDSSSSTNSSAPSTPAMLNLGGTNSPYLTSFPSRTMERKFTFPDAVPEVPDIVLAEPTDDCAASSSFVGTVGSEDSQATVRDTLKVDDREDTLADSQGSGAGDSNSSEKTAEKSTGHTWDRHKWNMSTIRGQSGQSSWSDVTIPLQNIEFKKNAVVGYGRFGKVLRGYYFGEVAVKFLTMDHVDEERRVEEFKKEVASFKNVRHDNIVLFLGFCLDQHSLGIVTDLCKGKSLFSLIHESTERFDLSAAVQYALQICQGVSYLHTKKIVHKDLRTRNIFIESKNKVVITDLGLFNMQRLKFPHRSKTMIVPHHWLSYLAPELIRALSDDWSEPPFSEHTDIYSFGTIWFEMLTCEMPWSRVHPDEVMWKVGRGMKAPLIHHMNTSREVKEIVLRCWAYSASDRPSLSDIYSLLSSLPKKRLDRSPSFPALRSYESIF